MPSQIRHRNRPGHHQLRPGLCGTARGRRPVRSGQRAVARYPATRESGRSARRGAAAFVPLSARRHGFSGGIARTPVGCQSAIDRWPPGAKARRGKRRPPGLIGEILALALRRGPHFAAAAVSRARRRGEDLAGGGEPPLSGASARRLERQNARCALRRAAGAGHGARLVRRRGARVDPRSRAAGRLSRTSRCSKSRRRPSTRGSSAMRIGASASTSAI